LLLPSAPAHRHRPPYHRHHCHCHCLFGLMLVFAEITQTFSNYFSNLSFPCPCSYESSRRQMSLRRNPHPACRACFDFQCCHQLIVLCVFYYLTTYLIAFLGQPLNYKLSFFLLGFWIVSGRRRRRVCSVTIIFLMFIERSFHTNKWSLRTRSRVSCFDCLLCRACWLLLLVSSIFSIHVWDFHQFMILGFDY